MVDETEDPPGNLEAELEGVADDLADLDEGVQELVDDIRDETDASLRLAAQYTGDEVDLLFVRDDIAERYSAPELDERVDALVVKGLGDPPREESLYDFGRLDAVIRWYDVALVAHFPYREWSGFVFTFDRQASPMVDLVREHLRD